MAQTQDLSNIYRLRDAGEWKRFIGSINEQQQFVGFPLAMVMYEAEHCHFCKESLPLVNELAGTYKGIIAVGAVDIDTMIPAGTPLMAGEASGKTFFSGINGTPQFWMYWLGQPVDHIDGKDDRRLRLMFSYWAEQYRQKLQK